MLEAKETRTDFIFQLADGSLLHLEFQTTASLDDLYRFLLYDARLIYHTRKIIRTVVIYAGEINRAADTLLKGTVDYQVRNVYLHGYDGDAVYQRLQQKAEKGEPFTRQEMLELIFLPLMKSSADRSEMAIKAAELAKANETPETPFLLGAIIAISDKFMEENARRKLLEVLKMTKIEQWIREEARAEGWMLGELAKARKTALNMLKKGYSPEEIAENTELPLEEVLELKKKATDSQEKSVQ
ncbi:hypothetical protein [Desulfurispora thermophila]|uniref:hypothetical protein n=1 Tax=Desulfurispora thermophila TaxID=265470 RepID=UPI00036777FE|nr:hypothetical protein [Desulfurispora thermophila]